MGKNKLSCSCSFSTHSRSGLVNNPYPCCHLAATFVTSVSVNRIRSGVVLYYLLSADLHNEYFNVIVLCLNCIVFTYCHLTISRCY